MINRNEVKHIYSKRIKEVVKKYSIDSGDSLFMRFLAGLPDAYTDDFLSKVKPNEITREKICCYDTYPVFANYADEFKSLHPAIANDNNNWKIGAFDRGYFTEILEDEELSAKERLAFAKQTEKNLLNYHFVLIQRPLSDKEKFIVNEIKARIILLEQRILAARNDEGLSHLWIYTHEQLKALSEELYQKKFIRNSQEFSQVFSSTVKYPCHWIENRTLLIYLLGLLFGQENTFPDPILQYVAKNFIFKNGKSVKSGVLYTQYHQKEDLFRIGEVHLKERYLTIFKLHQAIFKKT